MTKDTPEPKDFEETAYIAPEEETSHTNLRAASIRAVQGVDQEDEPRGSARKGADFQNWCDENVFGPNGFHGRGHRLTMYPEDNKDLDDLGNNVGISKQWRQSDSYIDDYGEIYELKAGYKNGGIDDDQAFEYSLMQEAGSVTFRWGGEKKTVAVKGVTYIFDSEDGAKANRSVLESHGFGILFRDAHGKLQQLD